MRFIKTCLIGLLVAVAFGGGCADRRAWTVTDEWYNPPAVRAITVEPEAVPCAQVKASSRGEALRRLAEVAAVQISREDANRYVEGALDTHGLRLFLVRAVCLNPRSCAWVVTRGGNDLFVHNGTLRRQPAPMTRAALVVALPGPPANVYVTASMAE